MTTKEAIALANRVKPLRRAALDKLNDGDALAKYVAAVTALSKSYAAMGSNLSGMTKQLSQVAADVEFLENFTPNAPLRRLHA